MARSTLFSGAAFDTGRAISVPPKRHSVMVHVSGELAVPLYLEALNGYWRVARVIRDAGSYAINGAQMLRVTLSGNNPSRVVVVAEF